MTRTRQRRLAVLCCVLAAAAVSLSGCGSEDDLMGSHPEELVGTWDELEYDRRMILDQGGSFRHTTITDGVPGADEGGGTWDATDVNLNLHLNSGRFRWLNSTNNATISFTFEYRVTGPDLALTFEILGRRSTTNYTRPD